MGDGNNRYWDGGMRHAHDGLWAGPFHLIFLLLVLALLVAGGIWVVRRLSHGGFALVPAAPVVTPSAAMAGADPAVAALRMRLASGEVSRDEFHRTMGDLTGLTATEPSGGEDGG